ncbi:hypothetical protein FMEAI12_3410033 [Parafrankia sp. Ea1.12]|nr:hypothetical protein FMEAI12_3410033 [Parafrankia sp. Ea1.12]
MARRGRPDPDGRDRRPARAGVPGAAHPHPPWLPAPRPRRLRRHRREPRTGHPARTGRDRHRGHPGAGVRGDRGRHPDGAPQPGVLPLRVARRRGRAAAGRPLPRLEPFPGRPLEPGVRDRHRRAGRGLRLPHRAYRYQAGQHAVALRADPDRCRHPAPPDVRALRRGARHGVRAAERPHHQHSEGDGAHARPAAGRPPHQVGPCGRARHYRRIGHRPRIRDPQPPRRGSGQRAKQPVKQRGIGHATAAHLSTEGCRVGICGRDPDTLAEVTFSTRSLTGGCSTRGGRSGCPGSEAATTPPRGARALPTLSLTLT